MEKKDERYHISEKFYGDLSNAYLANSLANIRDAATLLPKEWGMLELSNLIKRHSEDKDFELIRHVIWQMCVILNGNDSHGCTQRNIDDFNKKTDDFFIRLPLLSNVLNGNMEIVFKNNEYKFKITEKGERDIMGILGDLHRGNKGDDK